MKLSILNVASFITIGLSSVGLYNNTHQHVANLDNFDATITRNSITDTYKLRVLNGSEEIVKEIEYMEVEKLIRLNSQANELRLAEYKKLNEELTVYEELLDKGVKITFAEFKQILPEAIKKHEEKQINNKKP